MSATSLAGDLSVKNVEVRQVFDAEELVQSVSCLAQLPDPGMSAISINKILDQLPLLLGTSCL